MLEALAMTHIKDDIGFYVHEHIGIVVTLRVLSKP